eukprot:5739963-Prymnesium_polylepis.2
MMRARFNQGVAWGVAAVVTQVVVREVKKFEGFVDTERPCKSSTHLGAQPVHRQAEPAQSCTQ